MNYIASAKIISIKQLDSHYKDKTLHLTRNPPLFFLDLFHALDCLDPRPMDILLYTCILLPSLSGIMETVTLEWGKRLCVSCVVLSR